MSQEQIQIPKGWKLKKIEEIAEFLGVTQKVIEYRIYSAFDVLKKELEGFKIK